MIGDINKYNSMFFIKWAILLLVAVWLIYPVFYAVPVEGFSASLINLGMDLANGQIYNTDLLQPFDAEFFTLTKFGVVWEISLLVKYLGINGYTAIRIIDFIGLVLLLVSCVILIRRWAQSSYFIAIIAILIIPGITETSFFLSDNIIAAGLTTMAFVLFYQKHNLLVILGGIIFGLGVLNRPDLILLIPIIPVIFYDRDGLKISNIIIMFIAGIFAIAAWQLPLLLVNATIFDVINIGRDAIKLWARDVNYIRHGNEFFAFLSLSGLVFIIIGALALLRKKDYFILGLLLLPILVVNIVSIGTMWQARQLLGLSPFFAALTAIGIKFLINSDDKNGIKPVFAALIILLMINQILPYPSYNSDGPRYLYGGRFWAPIAWRNWQEQWNAYYANIKNSLSARNDAKIKVVISDYWDEDRYTHYALTDIGYNIDSKATKSNCPQIAEFFTKDDNIFIHIRLHRAFYDGFDYSVSSRLNNLALPCIEKFANQKLGTKDIIYVGKHYENIDFLPNNKLDIKPPLDVAGLNMDLLENRIIAPLVKIMPSLPKRLGIFPETLRIRYLDENGIKWLQDYYNKITAVMANSPKANAEADNKWINMVSKSRYKLD